MRKKNFGIALASLSIAHLLVAGDFNSGEAGSPIVIGEPLDPCSIASGYPYPAAYKPCNSWDIYAKGEFLYWSQQPVDLQAVAQKISLDGRMIDSYIMEVPYKPGFRVSLGCDLGAVVLDLTYTRVHSRKSEHFQAGENEGFRAIFAPPSVVNVPILYSTLNSRFHINTDIGLISLQKPVYFGKKIIMSLNYGVITTWLGQKWNFSYTPLPAPADDFFTDNGTIRANHKTWSVGPNLAVSATALLPWGFQAVAVVDLSIQYGSLYKGTQTSSNPNIPLIPELIIDNTTVKTKGSAAHLQAGHGGEIGLSWGRYFWCDKYHIDLSLTYVMYYQHVFLPGYAFTPFAIDALSINSFSLHGIVVGGRLDF